MKNLYARLYAGLLSFLERHQPGVGRMRLPNRVIVSSVYWGSADRAPREAERSVAPRQSAKAATDART